MSVDDRLREAFGGPDPTWDERTAAALHAVRARGRREVLTRRTAITVAAAAATAAVVVVVSNPREPDQSPAPEPPTPTPTSEAPNPLDGRWVSAPITRADVRRVARLTGDDAATMTDSLPGFPFRVTLGIDGDRSELLAHFVHGGDESLVDQENIELDGELARLTPQLADGETVHGWSLEGGALRFTFVSTTEASTDGASAEAWQRLLYDVAAFTPEG